MYTEGIAYTRCLPIAIVLKGFDESKEELSRVTREIHAKCGALFNNRSAVAAKEERAQQGANAGFYRFKLLGP